MENSKKLWPVTSILLLVCTMACRARQTQPAPELPVPQWQTEAGGKMQFEAASVRRSAPGTSLESNVRLDGVDGPPAGSVLKASAPLIDYVRFAYKIADRNQIDALYETLPPWTNGLQYYDIEARAAGSPSRDQLRLMVQAVLVRDFKLAAHWQPIQDDEIFLFWTVLGTQFSDSNRARLPDYVSKSPASCWSSKRLLRTQRPAVTVVLSLGAKTASNTCK